LFSWPLERLLLATLGTVTGVVTREKVAALTFDDGPHPSYTPRLLDLLAKHGAHATFFMVGMAAERYPEILERAAAEGHCLANHSWDHPSMPRLSGRERRAQLLACARALAPYESKLFRPPYGHQSLASRLDALRLGYRVVTWSGHCIDWRDHDAAWLAGRLREKLRPGAVILLHDALFTMHDPAFESREPMLAALDTVLGELAGSYRFVTVPELLEYGRARRKNWYKRGDDDWLARGLPGEVLRTTSH